MSSKKEFFKSRLEEVGGKAMKEVKYLNISYDDIVSVYEDLGLECPIMIRKGKGGHNRGWGNGYVLVPDGHEFYGKSYYDIDVSVHGGLTFSEVISQDDDFGWRRGHWIGFDTSHYGDNLKRWSKSAVFEETMMLFNQI